MTAVATPSFKFPSKYTYPPFFTLQPTLTTKNSQLARWSTLILRYCRHHRIFTLSPIDHVDSPLFFNPTLNKRLSLANITEVLTYMTSKDAGERAEWTTKEKVSAWIYWRRPEEWANLIAGWVEETGQKGSVLTVYELLEGEGTEGLEFHGMSSEVLLKGLAVLTKQGKAQVFGSDDQQGVKFF